MSKLTSVLKLLFLVAFFCGHLFSMDQGSESSKQKSFDYKVEKNENEKLIRATSEFYFTSPASFSSNNEYFTILITNGHDIKMALFSDVSMENITTIPSPVSYSALNFDGSLLATINRDTKEIDLWERKGKPPEKIPSPFSGKPDSATFSPDGNILAITYIDEIVRFWDIPRKTFLEKTFKGSHNLSFSHDGKKVAIQKTWGTKTAEVHNLVSDQPPISFSFQAANLQSLVFSPEGIVYGISGENILEAFNAETGKLLNTFRFTGTENIGNLVIYPKGSSIYGVTYGQAFEWKIGSNGHNVIGAYKPGSRNIIAISPNGHYVLDVDGKTLRLRRTKNVEPKINRHTKKI
jgi:WD40 repeat protein